MKITKRVLSALVLVTIAAACFVTTITGPTSVTVGDTVTYDIGFETNNSGTNGTAYVFLDVPSGWTFTGATYDATVNGAQVSDTPNTGVSTQGSPCVANPPADGYQRLGFSETFPITTANDSGVLHVSFTIGGADGPFTIRATGAGSFGGPNQQCNGTETLDVSVAGVVAPMPPRPSKFFSPSSIATGGTSRLTVILTNVNSQPVTNVSFTDTYPAGVVTATTPNLTTTCGGTASSTANSVSLANGTIPASDDCRVEIDVTAAAPGNYVNTIPAGTVFSSVGTPNTQAASATLAVGAASSATVPTMSEWALLWMGALLAAVAMIRMAR